MSEAAGTVDQSAQGVAGGRLQVRAIRGAVCAAANTAEAIEQAARRLVEAICRANCLPADRVISAIFTVTHDLDAQFPAVGARQAGWQEVPLLCAQEVPVPGSLPRCIRLLVHAYLPAGQAVRHVYLDGAEVLRPDWSAAQPAGGDGQRSATDGPARAPGAPPPAGIPTAPAGDSTALAEDPAVPAGHPPAPVADRPTCL